MPIKFFDATLLPNLEPNLYSNSGVDHHNGDTYRYFLPKNDWRVKISELNIQAERAELINPDFTSNVVLIETDPILHEIFWEKILPLISNSSRDICQKALFNYKNEVVARLAKFSRIETIDTYSYELMFNSPGKQSTAYNHSLDRTVGLHIDTHNVIQMQGHQYGFQLLTINLSRAPRYFFYVDLSVIELIEHIQKITQIPKNYGHVKELVGDFLSAFPDYPVNRVTIHPSQAYIAVSQNLIHDGGTNVGHEVDVAFLLGGYFRWQQI